MQEEKWQEALNAINDGADISCTDMNGNTPLHYAAFVYMEKRN